MNLLSFESNCTCYIWNFFLLKINENKGRKFHMMLFIRSIQYTESLWRILHKLFVLTEKPFVLSEEMNFKFSANQNQKCLWWQGLLMDQDDIRNWILRVSQTFVLMGMFQVTEHFQSGGTKKHNLTRNREHRKIWLKVKYQT